MAGNDPDKCELCDEARGYYLFYRTREKTQCAYRVIPTVLEDPLQVEYCQYDFENYPPDPEMSVSQVALIKLDFYDMGSKFRSFCFSTELFANVSTSERLCSYPPSTQQW